MTQAPDYHALFLAVCSGTYPSPLAYWAAQQFGHFELKKARWPAAEPRWRQIVDELIADEPLPAIPEHMVERVRPAPIDAAKGAPSKAWARKIVANPLRYPPLIREFARQALEGES